MKFILSLFMFFLLVQLSLGQKNDKKYPEPNVETVDFCELTVNPNKYEEKTVRTVAILTYGGEDFVVLYCPKCDKATIRPDFTDYFRDHTKGKRIGKLPLIKNTSGTVKLVLVGKFSDQHLLIDFVEKAEYLSKEAGFPERLSPKVRQKVDCKEK